MQSVTKIISDISLLRYCWQTDTKLFVHGFDVTARPHRRVYYLLDTASGKKVSLAPLIRFPKSLFGENRPDVDNCAPPNSRCSIATGGKWLFWQILDDGIIRILATNIEHRDIRSWEVSFKGVFAGSLLALPDKLRWALLIQDDPNICVMTGDVRHPGKMRIASIGLPTEAVAGRSGNGGKLLAVLDNHVFLAAGLRGFWGAKSAPKDGFPLFTFDPERGASSVRSLRVPLPILGSVEDIAYSTLTRRLAWWETLDSVGGTPGRSLFRLSTSDLDGRNVRILTELSDPSARPDMLRWLPGVPRLSFVSKNSVWVVKD